MGTIQATKKLKKILHDYFWEFFPQDGGPKPKVAWCTSVGPAELLIAMGFKVYYPENHGALLGATRESGKYIPVANAAGYSPEICSYLTSDVGAYKKGETPLTQAYGIPHVPHPDVLVYNTNQCREVQDWFSYYAREFKVPALGIFSPWKVGEVTSAEVRSVEEQFRNMIPQLESISKCSFDLDRLKEVVGLSKEMSDLWWAFLQKARHRPSPITFFDGCIQMAPAVVLRGTPVAVDYYKELNLEIDRHIAEKSWAIPKESYRLYWEGMPIWGRLRFFSDLLTRHNTVAVASTYCDSWIFESFERERPFESMALAYTEIFINRSEDAKEKILEKMMREYSVDGIIYHDSRTCPYNSNSRFGMPQRLTEKTQIPNLVIDGDLSDLRCFSDEQTHTAVEAFIEQLQDHKRRRPA